MLRRPGAEVVTEAPLTDAARRTMAVGAAGVTTRSSPRTWRGTFPTPAADSASARGPAGVPSASPVGPPAFSAPATFPLGGPG